MGHSTADDRKRRHRRPEDLAIVLNVRRPRGTSRGAGVGVDAARTSGPAELNGIDDIKKGEW